MSTTNAVLTTIRAANATVDSYGVPTVSTSTVLWSGEAAGYLKRVQQPRQSGGAARDEGSDTFTILDSALAPAVAVAGPEWAASHVTIRDCRVSPAVTKTFRVLSAEHRSAGLTVDSVKLSLDREQ